MIQLKKEHAIGSVRSEDGLALAGRRRVGSNKDDDERKCLLLLLQGQNLHARNDTWALLVVLESDDEDRRSKFEAKPREEDIIVEVAWNSALRKPNRDRYCSFSF